MKNGEPHKVIRKGIIGVTLNEVLADAVTPAAVRVRAVDVVLSHAAKAIEIEDIEARVAALEMASEQKK